MERQTAPPSKSSFLIQAVCKVEGSMSFQPCKVSGYNPENEKFAVEFSNGQRRSLRKLFICFDIEDPRIYTNRVNF